MRITLFIVLAAWMCFGQAPEPYDIKGDRLGMSMKDFTAKHPAPTCKHGYPEPLLFLPGDDAAVGVVACYPGPGSDIPGMLAGTKDAYIRAQVEQFKHPGTLPLNVTIANLPLVGLAFHFYKDRLFRIMVTFKSDDYSTMKTAFTEKFGPPVVTPGEVQNRLGAKFDAEESRWSNGVSAIIIKHRVADTETASVLVVLSAIQKEVEEAKPSPKKDL
jgi:hypothetical protein